MKNKLEAWTGVLKYRKNWFEHLCKFGKYSKTVSSYLPLIYKTWSVTSPIPSFQKTPPPSCSLRGQLPQKSLLSSSHVVSCDWLAGYTAPTTLPRSTSGPSPTNVGDVILFCPPFYGRELPTWWTWECSLIGWWPFLDIVIHTWSQAALWLSAHFHWNT